MGLIQIYVVKNGRCQLVNQYYLPPGDHIVNVDGGSSQTVSVYAGMTIPVRQCPVTCSHGAASPVGDVGQSSDDLCRRFRGANIHGLVNGCR